MSLAINGGKTIANLPQMIPASVLILYLQVRRMEKELNRKKKVDDAILQT